MAAARELGTIKFLRSVPPICSRRHHREPCRGKSIDCRHARGNFYRCTPATRHLLYIRQADTTFAGLGGWIFLDGRDFFVGRVVELADQITSEPALFEEILGFTRCLVLTGLVPIAVTEQPGEFTFGFLLTGGK
jgi:hypothetical protein